MLGVKQRECDSWNIKSCRAKIVYPGIEAGRKCYLQGLRSVRKIADPGFKNCVRIFQAGKNLLFGHVEKRLDYKDKVNFMTSQPDQQAITINILTNISRSKGNQVMKFDKLIEYHMRNHTQRIIHEMRRRNYSQSLS